MVKSHSVCKVCKQAKPRNEMVVRKTGYLRGFCKECAKENLKEVEKKSYSHIHGKFKKDYCENCGFRGLPCQLDIHHKNGEHKDNNLNNYITLCANCHRLITYREKQGIYK